MIFLPLLASLAQAQDVVDNDARLLGVEPAAQTTEAPATTQPDVQATVVDTVAPAAPAPAPKRATLSAPVPVDTSWLWSFGGPLGLLVIAAGGAWYVRKNGLKIPGMSGNGLANFQEGPQVVVRSRTPLAGQDVLAVVEITGIANPRRLLVAGGPGGSRLLSDLSAVANDESATSDAITRAVQTALAGAWATPQMTPAAPVPMAAAAAPMPVAPQPVVAAAPAPVAAPAATQLQHAASAPANTPPPAAPQATVEIVPVQFPEEAAANEEIDEAPSRDRQGGQAFEAELANELDHVEISRARRARRELVADPTEAAPRRGRRNDWRSAAYLSRDAEPIAEIGDGRPARDTRRPARARRMEDRKGRRRELERNNNSRGHLAALTRGAKPDAGQRFPNRRNGGVVRDAESRRERTEAARALLEQVMARRARDER